MPVYLWAAAEIKLYWKRHWRSVHRYSNGSAACPIATPPWILRPCCYPPIAAIARWAAPDPRPTVDRLAIGHERGMLTTEAAETLDLAWRTGYSVEMLRWFDNVHGHESTLQDLPPLQRTAYGTACRMVSATFESISRRNQDGAN